MARVEFVVIGGGPGGYVAARRLGQLGREVVLVERDAIGGVCLNQGCIPTKCLYAATAPVGRAAEFGAMGVHLQPQLDAAGLREWVAQQVATLRQGVERILAAVGVEVVRGEARLAGPGRVEVTGDQGGRTLEADAVVLATGSSPIQLPGFRFDGERIWSSWHALQLSHIPERLVVVGGGVIGLEMGTLYRRLGSQVTVVEMTDQLLPGLGLSRRGQAVLRQSLRGQEVEVQLGTAAQSWADGGVKVRREDHEQVIRCDAVLVAVGRRPQAEGLGLESVGAATERGFVVTDDALQAADGVYAVGDLRGGALLAHKAAHEGLAVADRLGEKHASAGQGVVAEPAIPWAVFTDPEVARVGLSEGEARARGYEVRVGRFPVGALGRALAEGERLGHFEVVAAADGRILGAELVAPHASDVIAEAALAVQHGLTLEQLADTVHTHPTFPEGLWEAALSALGRPLHGGR